MLKNIVNRCIDKGMNEREMQILAPMYKGENGSLTCGNISDAIISFKTFPGPTEGSWCSLFKIYSSDTRMTTNFNNYLEEIEQEFNITYNEEQKKAIKEALLNSVTIITGGPGTGKTEYVSPDVKVSLFIDSRIQANLLISFVSSKIWKNTLSNLLKSTNSTSEYK